MGLLGRDRSQPNSASGGVLSRIRQESEEQQRQKYQTITSVMPDLFNPMKQLESIKPNLAPPALPAQQKTSLPELSRMDWVREETNKSPALLRPIASVIHMAQAYTPLGSLQRGAANTVPSHPDIDHTANLPPEIGPEWMQKTGQVAGAVAGELMHMRGAGIRPVADPMAIGRAATQSATIAGLKSPLAQRAIEGAVAGGVGGVAETMASGRTDAKDIAIAGGLGAAGGGILDGGAALIGQKVKEAAEGILGRQITAANAIESASRSVPTNRLKVQGNTERLNSILEEINPIVTERMTPPLESKRSLAKWLQPHLDVSMNDINKLDFEDLRQLATDAQRNINLYDTTIQVAREKGHNLSQLLDGEVPTLKQAAERLRMGAVAGAIEPPKNVKVAIKNDPFEPTLPKVNDMESLGISALAKKGAKHTNPEDTRTYIATKTEREPLNVPKLVDDLYTKNVDNLQQINKFDKQFERAAGRKLSANERAYYLALNSRGADMTSKHILTERLVDSKGQVIGNSLKDITSQIPERAYTNFIDYQIAKHAMSRMARGETVYNAKAKMDLTKVERKIADYERTYPQFKEIADQLYDWDRKLGESWLVDTGLIPPEMFAAWREANPNWSPMQRKFSELEKRQQAGAKRGFSNQNNPVKKYSPTGSERDIIDPTESRIEYTDRYVKTARRNEVMQTVYRALQKNPDELDGFATILKREKLDSKTMGDIDELISSLDNEFNSTLKKSDLDKDNVISALVDGERVYMRVEDPDFLDALTNLTPQGQNAVIESARKVTGAMKLLTTGINPIFGLTRNIFRDIPEAYIYSKTTDNPFRFAWDTLDGFISVFADGAQSAVSGSRSLQKLTPQSFRKFLDNRAKLYKDYKAIGGGHSSPAAANRNLLKQSKRELLPQQKKGLGLAPRAYGALENLNNALESGPRLGEFKRSRQAGGDSYASWVKGLFEAQDITTNFKRHGQIVKDADAIVPYLNAAVQGLDKFMRAFKDRPAAVPLKALGVIAAPTIALYAMNYDNPAYKKLNNHTKDNFYLVPTTDGKFLKIPKPRELGVPFGGLLERTMRAWHEDDPEAFRDFADTARTMFAPPVIGSLIEGKNPLRDTIAGPLVELSSNENFMGAPIVPGYLQGGSPKHQYDANTSEIGKKIGEMINVSPKQVDHLIRSYTGVIGQLGLPATTQGATLGDTLTKQVTADSVFSTDASKYFYELKKKVDNQYTDAKRTGIAPKGYNDEVRKYLNQIASQLSDYSKALRDIDDTPLSREEKKLYKRQLTDQRNELARSAYEGVRDYLKSTQK